jgi:hypothetical protein
VKIQLQFTNPWYSISCLGSGGKIWISESTATRPLPREGGGRGVNREGQRKRERITRKRWWRIDRQRWSRWRGGASGTLAPTTYWCLNVPTHPHLKEDEGGLPLLLKNWRMGWGRDGRGCVMSKKGMEGGFGSGKRQCRNGSDARTVNNCTSLNMSTKRYRTELI